MSEEKSPYKVGNAYLFRCVTSYQIGRVEYVTKKEIVLSGAGWCADTGRFEEALRTGVVSEYEPAPDGFCIVGRGALVDAFNWNHEIPREVK